MGDHESSANETCPSELNCIVSADRNRFNESTAVLFHIWTNGFSDPTPPRRPNQYFVFAFGEPPPRAMELIKSKPKGFFNLTMSHRKYSDIMWPYGSFGKRSVPANEMELEHIRTIVSEKTKLVAWFVSSCTSENGRKIYVEKLKKYIDVDIFGKCGKYVCGREPNRNPTALGTKSTKKCDFMLTKDYKFYLSLENSLCREYVTKKFFERMDNSIVVPVVLERNLVLNSLKQTRKL